MRKSMCALVTMGLLLGLAGLVRADDQGEARAIIDRAIKVIGGEETLAKFKAHTFKEKGTYYGMGAGLPYTGSYAVQFPHQFKMQIEGIFTIVLNGDKGWVSQMGETKEMDADQLAQQKAQLYAGWVAGLTPLKDRAFTLSLIGESKVDDRPAAGVKVTRKDRIDVSLFFDKEKGHLVKLAYRGKAPEEGFKEVNVETTYRDYKEIDGIMVPTKLEMKRDGKQFVEAEVHDHKAHGKLDENVFAKP